MPEMQEPFPAMAMDGLYAGNAGAISGDGRNQYQSSNEMPAPMYVALWL
jgi:hypothetical protein